MVDSLDGIAPDLGRWVVEFAFGDMYTRPVLDARQCELVTLGSLVPQGDTVPELRVHIAAALHVGLTREHDDDWPRHGRRGGPRVRPAGACQPSCRGVHGRGRVGGRRHPDLAGINRILKTEGFRGGVFGMLDPAFVRRDPETFYRFYWRTFLKPRVRPDAAHRFLARLEREGRLDGVATMNIDCLHQQAGSHHVCEYWGDMRLNHCAACGWACTWDRDTGTGIHHCPSCGGTVVPDFVTRRLATYPKQVAEGRRLIAGCDLLIVIGTQTIPTPPHGTPIVHIDLKPHPPAPDLLGIQGRADDVFTTLDAIY